MCVRQSQPPGPDLGDSPSPGDENEAASKHKYLLHAREASYAMQGESLVGGKDTPSFLGGKFLRMYLDHKLDPDTVAAAGNEIGASTTWKHLEQDTGKQIQDSVSHLRRAPSGKEVADVARKFLKSKKKAHGIAFRGALNSVIGGIQDIDVGEKAVFPRENAIKEERHVEYELDVTVFDAYDFANTRKGEYRLYRLKLANLLKKNRFCEFEKEYWGEMCPGPGGPHTHLNSKAAFFASFMYALEQRGWTPGPLPWHVTIPMHGTFKVREQRAGAASAR